MTQVALMGCGARAWIRRRASCRRAGDEAVVVARVVTGGAAVAAARDPHRVCDVRVVGGKGVLNRLNQVVQSMSMKRDANRQRFLSLDPTKYLGRYIVIVAGKLIGADKDLGKLMARARKEYPDEVPYIGRMRDPRKVYIL